MIEPSIDELLDEKEEYKIGSKFELITMVSRRAKQINNGAEIMVETLDKKPVTIALQEINAGFVQPLREEP